MQRNDSRPHQTDPPALTLGIDPEALRPLIAVVVEEILTKLSQVRAALPERLAFTEPEAARLLSLNTHQLRDERRRGNITASVVVGRRVRYLHEDLVGYLMSRRTAA